MRKVIFGLIGIALASCGAEEEQGHDNVSEQEVEQIDSSETDIISETEKEYISIEDYATLRTKEDLISAFGEENLVDGESWFGEGTVKYDHSVLTNPNNGHEIKYIFKDDDPNAVSFIEARLYLWSEDYEVISTQKIETECGVYTGMALTDLREWNGDDFGFSGFGWDYEGGIFEKEGSKIADCPVTIKLSFDMEVKTTSEDMVLFGDMELNTADDNVQDAPIVVDMLTYYFMD